MREVVALAFEGLEFGQSLLLVLVSPLVFLLPKC